MAEINPNAEHRARQEIAELERLLEQKKGSLAESGGGKPEREIFGEAFRETYGEVLGRGSPAAPPQPAAGRVGPPPPVPLDEVKRQAEAIKSKAAEEQLEHLIAIAFSKGVSAAAEVARHAAPWLMDELHDRLADRYYQRLVDAKRLKQL